MKLKVESLKQAEIELRTVKSTLHDKNVQIDELIKSLEAEKDKRDEQIAEKDKEIALYRQYQKRCEELEIINESLSTDLRNIKESMVADKLNVEGNIILLEIGKPSCQVTVIKGKFICSLVTYVSYRNDSRKNRA